MAFNRILNICLYAIAGLAILNAVLFFILGARALYILSVGMFFLLIFNQLWFKSLFKNKYLVLLNLFFFCYTVMIVSQTGGIHSAAILLLILVPVFSGIMLGVKWASVFSGITLLSLLVFIVANIFQFQMVSGYPVININPFFNIYFLAVFICTSLLAICFSFEYSAVFNQLQVKNSELDKVKAHSKNAVKVKSDFLANMSHEIRNPMNGIIGMMHVLLESGLDKEQRKYANIVHNSARALLTIVNDILDLSKIESGMLDFNMIHFDLRLAMEDITALPALQARQKGIEFSYHIDPQVPCRLKGDIGRIRQIINNLTGNAVKFTQNGEVTVSVTLESDTDDIARICFTVDDTGIGIAPDQMDQVFESFTQADISTTKVYGGTGLGLPISKRLVEKMNGTMGAESVEMIGSTFWFVLPLEKQPEETCTRNGAVNSFAGCRVLITSDDIMACGGLEEILFRLGLEYDRVDALQTAIQQLRKASDEKQPYAVLVADIHEYDEHAHELGTLIKAQGGLDQTRLVVLTSVGKKGDAKRFEEAGYSAFLSKPVTEKLLKDCLEAIFYKNKDRSSEIITRYSIEETKKYQIRILVVDDQKTNQVTAVTLLDRLGYSADVATNGSEAVSMHQKKPYHLILLDCQMPEMDGFEACRQIREFEKPLAVHTPIIAMTGNAFQKDREKCIQSGMDDFISKPVDPEILAQVVQSNLALVAGYANDPDKGITGRPGKNIPEREIKIADVKRFDKAMLMERFGNNADIIKTIVDSFIEETPGLIMDMEKAIQKNDMSVLQSCAHALKGSAANVNAEKLKLAALDVETDAANKDTSGLGSKFTRIIEEYKRFVEEMSL